MMERLLDGSVSLEILGLEHFRGSGDKGIRTPDLFVANETLYQLSYAPSMMAGACINAPAITKRIVKRRGLSSLDFCPGSPG